MAYRVVVQELPERRAIKIWILDETPAGACLIHFLENGLIQRDIVPEGEEALPTWRLPEDMADALAHALRDRIRPSVEHQDQGRRIAYLEGELAGLQRHLDDLRRTFHRATAISLVPEPVAQPMNTAVLSGPSNDGDADYWRRRAMDAEATIRDTLGESPPAFSVGGLVRQRALDADAAIRRDASGETPPVVSAPARPRRVLDVEPAPDAPLSRTIPGFAGEDA